MSALETVRVLVAAALSGQARINRKLDRITRRLGNMANQNDQVMEQVAQLRGSNDQLLTTLQGVSSDVTDLLARVENLPVGEPLTEQTLTELRDAVSSISQTTNAFAEVDARYSATPPADEA